MQDLLYLEKAVSSVQSPPSLDLLVYPSRWEQSDSIQFSEPHGGKRDVIFSFGLQ